MLDANVWGTVADWVSGLGTVGAIATVFYQIKKDKENQEIFYDLDILISKQEKVAHLIHIIGMDISNEANQKFQPIEYGNIDFHEVTRIYIRNIDILTQILIHSVVIDRLIEKNQLKNVVSFEDSAVKVRESLDEFIVFFENKVKENFESYDIQYSKSENKIINEILSKVTKNSSDLLTVYKENIQVITQKNNQTPN
ncbi:hypothetical protein [Vagococcus hydrophili]|uniref:Uncharacterized protein n=1 Tax=Vagococcus hydrophili TaxID=2714947 RepID=A0A6G8APZ5_9ENTE|nr:hypothetical protein [Vagococcus hydrophili]QIL47050.1 hypothetical protein G7082_00150 [Vagococcus hydrophili]